MNCFKCIPHDRAMNLILKFDEFSGMLLIPIAKAFGACKVRNDVKFL